MTVLNDMDRFHLAEDAIKRSGFASAAGDVLEALRAKLVMHSTYICEHGEDMPEIRAWRWSSPTQN
jgi:xylulose-5-phosphate/fructose-6-phosphate phosphoketolase